MCNLLHFLSYLPNPGYSYVVIALYHNRGKSGCPSCCHVSIEVEKMRHPWLLQSYLTSSNRMHKSCVSCHKRAFQVLVDIFFDWTTALKWYFIAKFSFVNRFLTLNFLDFFPLPALLQGKWVISKMRTPFFLAAYRSKLLTTSKLSQNVHPKLHTALCGIIQVCLHRVVCSILSKHL